MKLSELKKVLEEVDHISFYLPNGEMIPSHFHVTEVGQINKNFIDCGGTLRSESVINFQLWTANDYDHKLSVERLKEIIKMSENALALNDAEIEVEYQAATIGKYHLDFKEGAFHLLNTQTACLAPDNCGIPAEKTKVSLASLSEAQGTCTPGSGCC